MEYFKALMQETRGKQFTLYGTSETKWNQTPQTQAEHIALIRGHGTSKIIDLKVFSSGEEWFKDQYGYYP